MEHVKTSVAGIVVILGIALGAVGVEFALAQPAPAKVVADDADGKKGKKEKKPKKVKETEEAAEFMQNGPLPRLHIWCDPTELRRLNDRPREYIRAQVFEKVDGQPDRHYGDVGIHLKGGAGSFRRVEDKPALTLNFDKFVDGQDFHGLDKIHLNNSVQDGTYMMEALASYVFREAGCAAPRVSNARVWLNGRDLGPYVLKEGFDGLLFKTFFKDKTGMLYEGSYGDIDRELPLHPGVKPPLPVKLFDKAEQAKIDQAVAAQRKAAHAKMKELVDASRDPDLSKRKERLNKVLDVDHFITFLACESIVAFWDGYGNARNNFRIYDNPKTGKLVFMPQGMDGTFEQPGFPLAATHQAIVSQGVLATPEDKQKFYERVADVRQKVFTPEKMTAEVDRLSGRLAPLMAEINPGLAQQHKNATASARQRMLDRIQNIDRQLLQGPPKPLKFDGPVADLGKMSWAPTQTAGNVTVDKIDESGKALLRVKAENGGGNGSWRLGVLLEKGRYTFEGRMKLTGVAATSGSPMGGAGLRISGAEKPFRMKGDVAWQEVRYEFEVTEPTKEVVLVADLNAGKGVALFEAGALKLRKK